jgi:hypothetical protein
VSLRVESDPSGADVFGPEGAPLGRTPLTTNLPRSGSPVTLMVSKTGYAPSRHTITPDRDVAALVNLRAVAARGGRPAGRPEAKSTPPSRTTTASAAPAAGSAAEPGATATTTTAEAASPAETPPPPAAPAPSPVSPPVNDPSPTPTSNAPEVTPDPPVRAP